MCERVCMDRQNEIDFRFELVVYYCLLSHLGFIYLYLLVQTFRFQHTRLHSSGPVDSFIVALLCLFLSDTSCFCVYFGRVFFLLSCPENCISCHLHLKKMLLIFVDALFELISVISCSFFSLSLFLLEITSNLRFFPSMSWVIFRFRSICCSISVFFSRCMIVAQFMLVMVVILIFFRFIIDNWRPFSSKSTQFMVDTSVRVYASAFALMIITRNL